MTATPGRPGPARAIGIALASAALVALVVLPSDLLAPARAALAVFGIATILWAATRTDPAWVALAGATALLFLDAVEEDAVLRMLSHDVIWLMIGAFVIGGAVDDSGLSLRMTRALVRRAQRVGQLFWLTTAVLTPLTFLIPSTSGRAAAVLPALRLVDDDPAAGAARRAYAILIPTVILVATSAALTGAGSHLLLDDLLGQRLGDRFGYARWALWGLPFAIAASVLACLVVSRLFLTREQRDAALPAAEAQAPLPLSGREWRVLAITGATLALWSATEWHGLEIATVAMLAMLALTAPGVGTLGFKKAAKAVSWNLVIFVGGAMVLGQALIDTQAATWVMDRLMALFGLSADEQMVPSEGLALTGIAAIAVASHLFVTSHVARAAALGAPLILFAQSTGLEPMAVLFIAAVGTNYCLTLPVCSKAYLVFQDAEGGGFAAADLLRLSMVMAPLYLLLMIVTYYGWWRWTGLSLTP